MYESLYFLTVIPKYTLPKVITSFVKPRIYKPYTVPTRCIYVYCVDLRQRLFPHTALTGIL